MKKTNLEQRALIDCRAANTHREYLIDEDLPHLHNDSFESLLCIRRVTHFDIIC